MQIKEEWFKSDAADTRITKRHKSRASTNLRNLCSKLERRLQNYAAVIKIQISDKAKHLSGLVYIICSKYSSLNLEVINLLQFPIFNRG